MNNNRLGKQTLCFKSQPTIVSSAAVGEKIEGEGPLATCFDYLDADTYFGMDSWESAESAMLKKCLELAKQKHNISSENLDCIFSGDLLNQCVGSAFAVKDSQAPFVGLYGACSTMAESLMLGAIAVDGGFADYVCALTSSHFCSAERQFRLPLGYGGQCSPTAQRTATAAGAAIVATSGTGPKITHATIGKILDGGVCDATNMGAAMAPSAVETLCTHFADTGRAPDYYDLIVTGDLGKVGFEILVDLCGKNGFDIEPNGNDCGLMIFDLEKQGVKSGGSGCGCSASVLCGHILGKMRSGELDKVLFCGTGAMMSPTTTLQGKPVMGICHAVAIENEVQ